MIKLIGMNRTAVLFGLLILNLVIATVFLGSVDPLREDTQQRLDNVTTQINRLNDDIQNIKTVISSYKEDYQQYRVLEARGFFSDQDRFEAGRILDELRSKSGLLGYSYNISELKTIAAAETLRSKSDIVSSHITLEKITSILDMNVYTLAHNLSTAFPAHARISKFQITKNRTVNKGTLANVVNGTGGFINATVELDWLTMAAKNNGLSRNTTQTYSGGR